MPKFKPDDVSGLDAGAEEIVIDDSAQELDEANIDDGLSDELAECLDDAGYTLELANIELKWATRAISTLRLGMNLSSPNEFPQTTNILEDSTMASVNDALRSASLFLARSFDARGNY